MGTSNPYKKGDEMWLEFLEDLMLNVCKGYMFLSTCEYIWLQSSMLCQCPHVSFSLYFGGRSNFYNDHKNYEPTCVISSCIYNDYFCKFQYLDV